jgi:hypothetical protein
MVRPELVSTPMPPGAPGAPTVPPIEPLLLSVVIEQFSANTPSPPPAMAPPPVTRIDPPLLKTGPVTGVEIVFVDGVQAAQAAPGIASTASAASEAPVSSVDRESRPGFELVAMDCENPGLETPQAAETREFIPESPQHDPPNSLCTTKGYRGFLSSQ